MNENHAIFTVCKETYYMLLANSRDSKNVEQIPHVLNEMYSSMEQLYEKFTEEEKLNYKLPVKDYSFITQIIESRNYLNV